MCALLTIDIIHYPLPTSTVALPLLSHQTKNLSAQKSRPYYLPIRITRSINYLYDGPTAIQFIEIVAELAAADFIPHTKVDALVAYIARPIELPAPKLPYPGLASVTVPVTEYGVFENAVGKEKEVYTCPEFTFTVTCPHCSNTPPGNAA